MSHVLSQFLHQVLNFLSVIIVFTNRTYIFCNWPAKVFSRRGTLILKLWGLLSCHFDKISWKCCETLCFQRTAPKLITSIFVNYQKILIKNVICFFLPMRWKEWNYNRSSIVNWLFIWLLIVILSLLRFKLILERNIKVFTSEIVKIY